MILFFVQLSLSDAAHARMKMRNDEAAIAGEAIRLFLAVFEARDDVGLAHEWARHRDHVDARREHALHVT